MNYGTNIRRIIQKQVYFLQLFEETPIFVSLNEREKHSSLGALT